MNGWIDEILELARRDEPAVLVTVADVRGSAPRETGAKMVVSSSHAFATIGGGELEFQCTRIASEILKRPDAPALELRKFTLGSNCGQCCGGVVDVLFDTVTSSRAAWIEELAAMRAERRDAILVTDLGNGEKTVVTAAGMRAYPARLEPQPATIASARELLATGAAACRVASHDSGRQYLLEPIRCGAFDVALFGAGHVGSALVAILSQLDCNIRWVDNRRGVFPESLPANVSVVETRNPMLEVSALPAGSYFLVMTHSHSLDFGICDRVLRRADFALCGLIGSRSKRRRFERLMRQQGMPEALIGRLTCPIGVPGVGGKRPQEIAVAVSAQLLQRQAAKSGTQPADNENVVYVETRR
ncbi:MAG: xanthine dehydrogenase accessory protein XdhC [Gammaproteobacteria bacterium]|nr:xanthine dehydrogenase accessory protein XdhC [Gammaproteobacteria bacterium]